MIELWFRRAPSPREITKRDEAERLAADVAAYLERGGMIEHVETGQSGLARQTMRSIRNARRLASGEYHRRRLLHQ